MKVVLFVLISVVEMILAELVAVLLVVVSTVVAVVDVVVVVTVEEVSVAVVVEDSVVVVVDVVAVVSVVETVEAVVVDVVEDPVLQPALHLVLLFEGTDLVAHDALEVVREAASGEQVRQARCQVGVGSGIRVIVFGRFLQ